MFGKILAQLSAFPLLAAIPGAAVAESLVDGPQRKQDSITQGRSETGGQSYGDRNRGGPRGFYSYPRHRHIDGRSAASNRRMTHSGSAGTSPNYATHGSAYYGLNYGAPYFGGGYYDDGVYYRERRDR